MTLAGQLAGAVAGVLRARAEALALARRGLLERRDELRRVAGLPSDAERLERQYAELERELRQLDQRSAALEEERERLGADFGREFEAVRARLVAACAAEIELQEAARNEGSFNEAVNAFRDALNGRGVEPGRATPAQLRQHLPYLQTVADHVRARAAQLLERAAAEIAENPEHVLRQREVEAQRRQLAEELEAVTARIRAHQNSDELPLFRDIETADVATVRRVRREVLQPLLDSALVERQKGLAGSDPLEQVGSL